MKFRVPAPLRHYARKAHRDFVFAQAMRPFRGDPAACARIGHPTLLDLMYGWGYERRSGKDIYLAACIQQALNTRGPILECGSGLSTILIGEVARQRGLPHWALEHTPRWAASVQRQLRRQKLEHVRLSVEGLRDYGDFSWYNPPLESMPAGFAMVVCDGPPGYTKGGRYGLLPIMRERLEPGCVILLDDADREQELAAARRWEVELGVPFEIRGGDRPYVAMTLGPEHPASQATAN